MPIYELSPLKMQQVKTRRFSYVDNIAGTIRNSVKVAEAKSVINNARIPKGKKVELLSKILEKAMGARNVYLDFISTAEYVQMPDKEENNKETKPNESGLTESDSNKTDSAESELSKQPDYEKSLSEEDIIFHNLELEIENFTAKENFKN